SSVVTPLTSRGHLNRWIPESLRKSAMENLAAVERRALALVKLSMAMRSSAVENQRRGRRRLLMVGAMVAKLAKLRRSRIPTTRFHHPQTSEVVVFRISPARRLRRSCHQTIAANV